MSLADTVRKAGITGAGGAGFPAHAKYGSDAEVFIINGAECEPLAAKDAAILSSRAADIVTAAAAIREELGARDVALAVKAPRLASLKELYGGVRLAPLADVYPAGDEALLVYEVTGRRVPAGGFPPDVGVVVSNVETVLNVARASRGKKVTETWVTVAGAVRAPFTAAVPVGTPASFLVAEAGGAAVEKYAVFDGGPMMGREVDPAAYGVGQSSGVITVLPEDSPAVAQARIPLAHVRTVAGSACTQCRDCTELCPRYLMGYDVTPHLSMRRFFGWGEEGGEEFFGNAAACTGCGLCELYACPMVISPRRVQLYLRGKLEGAVKKEGEGRIHPDRAGRQVPRERLKKRLAVAGFDRPAPPRELREPPRRVIIDYTQPYCPGVTPAVAEGDRVAEGDLVAAPPAGAALGVPVYAGIAGRVAAVDGGRVIIDRTQVA